MTYICRKARGLGSNWRHRQRVRLHQKQNTLCFWCGKECTLFPVRDRQMTIDHVVAVCEGGTHEDDNLVGACKRCNTRRGIEQKKRLRKAA